jgi:hypothetical protein
MTLRNNDQGGAADLWQAAHIDWPSCEIDVDGGPLARVDCGNGPPCAQCTNCVSGPCADAECDVAMCDPYSGRCVDRCAGVQCRNGQVCNPEDGQCAPANLDVCDTCEFNEQCANEGVCVLQQAVPGGETFCAQTCAANNVCPEDFVCGTINGIEGSFCLPIRGTCVDRCAGVQCRNGQVCNAFTGQCGPPPCDLNSDCRANQYCDRVDRVCVTAGQAGGLASGSACESTADCALGLACANTLFFGASCTPICDVNEECPANESCYLDLQGGGRFNVCSAFPI